MTEGLAIVIAAVISVGGIVLTQLFNYLQRKADIKERLFFDIYQKRLSVYEEVIKELQSLVDLGIEKVKNTKGFETANRILPMMHSIDILVSRLTLFGSAGSIAPLVLARAQLLELHTEGVDNASSTLVGEKAAVKIIGTIRTARNSFVSFVSTETGRNFIDNRLTKTLKEFASEKSAD